MTKNNALIEASGLVCGYSSVPVVYGLDLVVYPGEVVALLGANGAGKTTTLLTLSGELPALGGEVLFRGKPTRAALHRRARMGMAFLAEERDIFKGLRTIDNLRLARGDVTAALDLFPELKPRIGVLAGQLSGGEQQMLALARALSREPVVLLADELSLGLAPMIVERLLTAIREVVSAREVGALLVEQHVRQVLGISDRGYVMSNGHVAMSGSGSELLKRLDEVEATYLRGDTEATLAADQARTTPRGE